jgi:hypothetical protein
MRPNGHGFAGLTGGAWSHWQRVWRIGSTRHGSRYQTAWLYEVKIPSAFSQRRVDLFRKPKHSYLQQVFA